MRLARYVSAAVVCSALVSTAACSSSSQAGTSHTNGSIAPTPTSKAYVAQVEARQRATLAYAQQVVDRAPQLAGETPLTTAPPNNLQDPDEMIGAANLVTRDRYWKAPATADQVYRALRKTPVPGLMVSGHGLPSSPAEDQPNRGFLSYPLLDPPPFIEGGELYMEMEPAASGGVIIAVFAEVYAHPVRSADEHINLPVTDISARWPKLAIGHPRSFGKVAGHPLETLTPAQATALVDDFNRSPVANDPDGCFGGLGISGAVLTVSVVSAGARWELTYPGTSCQDLSVTRNRVQFPALQPGSAFVHLLHVLSHGGGTLVGHLVLVGGPAGAPSEGISGTTVLSSNGVPVSTTHTRSAQGYFLLSAPPGSYELTGSSIHFQVDGKPGHCAAAHDVTIRTDATTHADVYCQRR